MSARRGVGDRRVDRPRGAAREVRALAAGLVALAAILSGCAIPPVTQSPAVPPHATGGGVPATTAPANEIPVPAPTPAPVPIGLGEPSFEIGLAWDLDSTSVGFQGSQVLEVQSHDRPGVRSTLGPLAFRVSGNQLLVTPRDRPRAVPMLVLHTGDTLWVGSGTLARGEAPLLQWNGGHWRGRFKIFLNPRGRLTVATRLPLERYLLGVVPGEIGALSDSLLEAGRAQAVAARSYTLFYRARRASEGFDLFGTVEDQLYSAAEAEKPLATRCVESTRGLVGLSGGAPIRANYCSTCGGISAEAWEAWPTSTYDYLTSHADAGTAGDYCASSPHYRWREEWSAHDFAANLTRFAPQFGVALPPGGVGELVDVRVMERSRSGRVWWLEVETTTGLVRIHAHVLRQVLRRGGNPGAILRSNLFKIAVRRDPDTHRALAVVASGAGSGHGVGLCQTGALAMARQGSRGEAILAHYYPGAALRRIY
ncbi:MAG TPA: SpoIID/LytB domain-containing protein [Candidatus Eisenbacteria bacterium]